MIIYTFGACLWQIQRDEESIRYVVEVLEANLTNGTPCWLMPPLKDAGL